MCKPKSKAVTFPLALFALIAALLAVGCRGQTSTEPTAQVPSDVPGLLPTPTLAAPGSVDPLRPPTPIVMPSPTPLSSDVIETPSEAEQPNLEAPLEVQPIPTVTLPEGATPAELLALGQTAAAEGDHLMSAAAFRAVVDRPGDLATGEIATARLGLAVALMALGDHSVAAVELEAVIQEPQFTADPGKGGALLATVDTADVAAFHLGQVRARMGDHAGAIDAYRAYLQNNPDMAAYVEPLIANAYEALGDTEGVITALEGAVTGPAQRFKAVANRMRLAELYLARQEYANAIAQYDAVHDIARTEATKGQMTYLAGRAEIMAGNTAAGYERFQRAITDYPRAAESYQALVALVDAGIPVDEYQRGVVDYYAGAYLPAVEAFRRYLSGAGDEYNTDAHVFLAWSLERLGDVENALAELDPLTKRDPARALFERAGILHRAGRQDEALAAYDEFLERHGDTEGAAGVAWSAAALADEMARDDTSARYLFLADTFPFDENAPLALFRAADLLQAGGDDAEATALRLRLAEQYPANIFGAEALFRLLQAAESNPTGEPTRAELVEQVASLSPTNYFALRAADLAAGIAPFTATGPMSLAADPDEGRAEAEAWLRERLAADGVEVPAGELGDLSLDLAADPHRIIGEKLWQLDLQEEAKAELELVRESYAGDPLATYRLARFFGELGLYRSSIIAAAGLLRDLGATVFDAPLYLGRLSYPVYYADLIMPLAERYDFDPRIQFALVRQESLFESFARSGAAAQGLSQVIPDTGAWIAQRLAWPNFVNEDLYKPYVGLNFGAYYLSQQLHNFDGHVHAALAAYNGGPGNAARWLEVAGVDLDRFVDVVDFPETRLYIERIYEGYNAYRHLYGGP